VITQARLKELLDYDPVIGVFKWKVRRGRSAPAGSIAGRVSKAARDSGGGYRWIGVDGKEYLAHRLAWLYMTGEMPTEEIDHRNTERTDNRFENLRKSTGSQNMANKRPQSNNTTGFKGVSLNKATGKYVASIKCNGQYEYLGLHATPELAHAAYVAAASRLFGEFARAS
jgi:hypothetical protein